MTERPRSCSFFLLVFVFALLGIFSASACFGNELEEIRNMIRAKGHKWIAGETSVSKLPGHERKIRCGLLRSTTAANNETASAEAPVTGLAASLDWRSVGGSATQNFVTPVRDQGNCGSCWAFATAGALESYILIKGNQPGVDDNRAEEILLSCCSTCRPAGYGTCQGGYVGGASEYIKGTGLPPESYFPYTAAPADDSCGSAQAGWQTSTYKIGTWSYVTTTSVSTNAIKTALANGPLVTTFDVYNDFFSYAGGIYEYATGSLAGGHAVLIVGYTDNASVNGGGYFIVKNSWGTGWGEGGYFRIAYSQTGSPVGFGEYTIAYQAGATPPVAPSTLTATEPSSNSIKLTWTDNALNESGFRIERCAGANCSNFAQVTTVGSNATTYTNNSGLTPNTSYTYRIRAYNSGGDSAYSSGVTATTLAAPPPPVAPAAPTNLSEAAVSRTQVSLSWTDKSTNESGFKIERCTGAGCTGFAQIVTVGANVTSYINTGLRKATTYSYRVRAYNAGANSDYSNIVSVMTRR